MYESYMKIFPMAGRTPKKIHRLLQMLIPHFLQVNGVEVQHAFARVVHHPGPVSLHPFFLKVQWRIHNDYSP